jgi:hypothetical protein
MGVKSPKRSQLDTFALAAVLAISFAAIPVLMWSANGTLWFFQ